MTGKRVLFAAAIVALFATITSALAPHEVLVLVNGNSPESIRVAREFARLRQVPDINIAYLPLPEKVLNPPAEFTPEEFTKYIWEPANQFLRDRQLQDQVLAWVYSVDFPVRITTDPAISLQGITFVRNEIPPADSIRQGTWKSPIFAGPDKPNGPMAPSHSMNWFRAMGGDRCPIPSMMLGFIGSRGNDMDEILGCLQRGARADGTRPTGTVFFVSTDGIRSTCRAWQYPGAIAELGSLGIQAAEVPAVPAGTRAIGILMGMWAQLEKLFLGPITYLPGCMGEHLTSCGAMFDYHDQVKLTWWIRAGATASAGTVTEPNAIWTKFPNARFFAHYGRGCTLLESFFQSIGSPLQILLVGEPLARPWTRGPAIRLVPDEVPAATNLLGFTAAVGSGSADTATRYSFLLDGRVIPSLDGARNRVQVDTAALADGCHELRALAWPDDPVRQNSSYAVTNFVVNHSGRAVALSGIAREERMPAWQSRVVRIVAAGEAEKTGLMQCGRIVIEEPGSATSTRLDLAMLGPGTQELQPYACYADGETVVGAPVFFTITEDPPKPAEVQKRAEPDGSVVLDATAGENVDWFESFEIVPADPSGTGRSFDGSGGQAGVINGVFTITPSNAFDTCVWTAPRRAGREIAISMSVSPGSWSHVSLQTLGLIFNRKDANNFDFFGLCGDTSAWVLGRFRKGQLERVSSRGRFIHPEAWYALSVRAEKAGVRGYINGEPMCFWPGGRIDGGPAGVLASQAPGYFRDLRVTPPTAESVRIADGGQVRVTGTNRPPLIARTAHGLYSVEQAVAW
jgi:uncharacterized protein (TIGR03790 family)